MAMFLSDDECTTWLKDHDIDPVIVFAITLLPQTNPRGGRYVIAKFESVAVRYHYQEPIGQRGTAIEIHGGPDGYFTDVNHRLLEYLPGAESDKLLSIEDWLVGHGVTGCTRADSVHIAVSPRDMVIEGEFDLSDSDKLLYKSMFNEDFTRCTSDSCMLFSQQEVDELRRKLADARAALTI
jgi:hypothetical protein